MTIDDIAMKEFWKWVETSSRGLCETCKQDQARTRVIDNKRICQDCYENATGHATR